jgi:hypothetical protein
VGNDAVSLEWLSTRHAILRHHPARDGYGGEFDLMCVVELVGDGWVLIRGLLARVPYRLEHRRAIAAALRSEGVHQVSFERRSAHPRTVTVTR